MTKRTAKKVEAASRRLDTRRDVASTSEYRRLVSEISELLAQARHSAARSVNALLTATYWEIDRRIVEFEQGGKSRAGYGEEILIRLSQDLTAKHGRGFSGRNLRHMRAFFLGWEIWQTPSAKSEARVKCQTESGKSGKEISQTVSAKFEARAKCPAVSVESEKEIRQTASAKSVPPSPPVPTVVHPEFTATGGILTRVFASKYLTNLPDEETLRREILTTQRALRARWEEK